MSTDAGNHGLEILHADGSKFVHPLPMQYEDKVSELLKILQESVRSNWFNGLKWAMYLTGE